ncbi:MoaD/ThiS family protein [Nocardioides sp. JQ2195]|uniref:MoaD/ThiS family protein n=1 Tax=Nocardioides sp. JQ2195 TaxID=2592334 RepID=UPI00143ED011|nr:MoaD/ThiS family protein [Nocardioides sp. JQ2195]QIX25477.1 MoaD/ThiS family protein [Nocardioides sp. JQ2195]
MSPESSPSSQNETQIIVRYWASARAATGVNEDRLSTDGTLSISDVRDRVLALHPDSDNLERVVASCSVLVDDEPLGRRDPSTVLVSPGQSVEFLPPFAGG